MRGELRHQGSVDVAAGLLVALAAVQATLARLGGDAAWQPTTPVDSLSPTVASVVALVTAALLVVGARMPRIREPARPAASVLLLLAAVGWCLSRVEPTRVLDPATVIYGGVESWKVTVPAMGAVLVTAVFAITVAVRLRSDRRAGEIAAGAVVTWGAGELAALSAAPATWSDAPPPIHLSGGWSAFQAWTVVQAMALPAAALVVLWWLAGPRPGARRIAARCRGACAAVAVMLLAEAFLAVSGLPASLPRVIALGAGAVCAALAAARWSLAPMLAPVAAGAGLASLLNHAIGEDTVREVFFPEPAPWVLVGVVPVVVALIVLWGMQRPTPQPLEPAGVPAVPPPPPPTRLAAAAVAVPDLSPDAVTGIASETSRPAEPT